MRDEEACEEEDKGIYIDIMPTTYVLLCYGAYKLLSSFCSCVSILFSCPTLFGATIQISSLIYNIGA